MRSFDWAKTSIGRVDAWPASLRTMVGVVLGNRSPMLLLWGRELIHIYNDAYRRILGENPPRSLGAPGAEIWAENWHVLGPQPKSVLEGGPSTWIEKLPLRLNRRGFLEDAYFTFSCGPVPDDRGAVGGVLVTVQETTEQVQGERMMRMLCDLAARSAGAKTTDEACRTAASILATNEADVPFALLYLLDRSGREARLAGASGLAAGEPRLAPARVPLRVGVEATGAWPFAEAARTGEIVVDLAAQFGAAPAGRTGEAPERAIVLALSRPSQQRPFGFLVAAVSPRRVLDERYRGLYRLTADQVVTAIANAAAHQDARRRAEQLAALHRAKTAFFSNVSLELRTPLTILVGRTEDLLSGAHGELLAPQREQLELVHCNALRLQRLVDALVDLSRVEADRARASEERFQLMADNAPMMVWVTEPDASCSFVSKSWYAFTGQTPATALGSGWLDALHPDDRARVREAFLGASARQEPVRLEYRVRRKDGEYRWAIDAAAPHHATDGRFLGYIGSVIDITERKQTEEKLRQLATVVENSSDLIGTATLDRKIVFLNQAGQKMVGLSGMEEALRKRVPEFFFPGDRDVVSRIVAHVFEHGRWRGELRLKHFETGAPIPVWLNVFRLDDPEGGKPLAIASVGHDLTELKRASSLTQTIADNATVGLVMMDARQHCTFMNKAAERLTGYSLEEVQGRPLHEFIHHTRPDGSPYPIEACPLVRALPERRQVTGEETFVKKDGALYPVAYAASPICDPSGAPIGTVVEMRDISGEKRAREERECLVSALQRTLHLNEIFAGVLAHDLQNPLAAILTAARMLLRRREEEGGKLTTLLSVIVSSGERMARMIDQLLDFTRVRVGGGIALQARAADLGDICRHVVGELEVAHPEWAIRIRSVGDLAGAWDADRLLQVVSNLVGNAVQHGVPAGGVLIELDGTAADQVVLRVHNDGAVQEELLPYLFDPFRGAEHRRGGSRGLGLGLFITQEIVRAHAGTVDVASSGGTTTFVVRLPRRAVALAA